MSKRNAWPLTIRPADAGDWPDIVLLRETYFRRMGRESHTYEEARWCVAVDANDRVLACFSWTDNDQHKQQWISDLYRVEGRDGLRAMRALVNTFENAARANGLDVIGISDPLNEAQTRANARHGYELVGLVWRKQCPQQS